MSSSDDRQQASAGYNPWANTGYSPWPNAASLEEAFEEYFRKHPGGTYAEFWAETGLRTVRAGQAHATLGPRLKAVPDWRQSGIGTYKLLVRYAGLTPESRVIDYGCGTFRVGIHMIEFLNQGHYQGLDVSRELLDVGMQMLGQELIREKLPTAAVIDAGVIAEAIRFKADCVFSIAVATHVHPREAGTYFTNLQRLTAQPGAVLLVAVAIADETPLGRSLALPLSGYAEALWPLEFVNAHGEKQKIEDGHPVRLATLEFRRPAQPASGAR
jgi:SAM-dependent methyltransferase